MIKNSLLSNLERLNEILQTAIDQNIDFNHNPDPSKVLYNFKEKRAQYIKDLIQNGVLDIKKQISEIVKTSSGSQDEQIAYDLSVQAKFLEELYREPAKAQPVLLKIRDLVNNLKLESVPVEQKSMINFEITNVHSEIKPELSADLDELKRCFSSACYRSCVILCGRILETTLHRKYFEATGQDILEKSPGIGLGNLVGKLKDKNIMFDPGLSQQIHLINQVRIFSVHKKQEVFNPSKDQTQAIILYTLDVVRRMF